MTTAKELIAYLQTIPEDTVVKVGREESRSYSCYMAIVDLDLTYPDFFPATESTSPMLWLVG